MKKIKLMYWKNRLKKNYKLYAEHVDSYPCGLKLLTYISPSYRVKVDEVNKCIKNINKLDIKANLQEIPYE